MSEVKTYKMKQSWDDIIFKVICDLFLVLFVIVVFYPLYFVVIASFSDPVYVNSGSPLLYPKGLNFNGYIEVFRDKRIWSGYANTIYYTVCGTVLGTMIVILSGYALSRKDLPGSGIIMKLYVFTMYFGGGLIPTYLVVSKLGLVNTRAAVIVMGCVSVYNMIVVRSFMLSNIPDELLDASRIDGCGNGRFFTQIVLPLSKAIIAVMVLYIAVGYWNSYFSAMIYVTD
ncbi:MAG: carbohydrate ABC transporter permease, partial [Lachnospiraceae bacterium]|nr:carbohydrate ABC transporter permease [Lachnospiraceae bacterium]